MAKKNIKYMELHLEKFVSEKYVRSNNNAAPMFRRLNDLIGSHTPNAPNTRAKLSGATFHMTMPQSCYLAKGAKRPSDTINMQSSSNRSV